MSAHLIYTTSQNTTRLTDDSNTTFCQWLIFGLLRDLNIGSTFFFDLLDVSATLTNDHACSAIGDQNLHLQGMSTSWNLMKVDELYLMETFCFHHKF